MTLDRNLPQQPPAARPGAILAAVLLTLAAGLAGADALQQARAELAAGHTRTAILALKDALQANPQAAGVRALLVRTYLDAGQGAAAAEEIARALAQGDTRADWAGELAESALMQGRFEEVLEPNPDTVTDAGRRAHLLAFQGEALMRLNRTAQADAALAAALAADPKCVPALLVKALRAHQDQDLAQARRHLDQALQADPRNAPAWSMRGELDLLEGKPVAAREAFDHAVELAPVKGMPRYQRAVAALDADDPKAARADLEAAAADLPGFAGLEQAWGRLLLLEDQPEEALKHLDLLLRALPDDPTGNFLAGAAHARLGHGEQTEDLLGRWLRQRPGEPRASVLLARNRLERGDTKGALALLSPLAEGPEASPALLATLAQALAADGRRDAAEAVLVRLVEAQPEQTGARLALAESRLVRGATGEALEDLQGLATARPDDPLTRELLIRGYLRSGEHDAALAQARSLYALAPQSPAAAALLGLALAAQGDQDGARKVLTEAATRDPGAPEVVLPLAALEVRSDHRDRARGLLDALLARRPAETRAILGLAALDVDDQQQPAAQERLTRALAAQPQNAGLRLALARFQIARNQAAAALSTLATAPPGQAATPDFLLIKAQAQLAAGQGVEAIASFEALLAARPDFVPAHYGLVLLYAGRGRIEPMTDHLLAGLHGQDPRPPAGPVITAALKALPDQGARRALLERILEADPEQPVALAERGALALTAGDHTRALKLFETLRRVAPEAPAGVAGLVAAQSQSGKLSEAAATGEQWLARTQPVATSKPAATAAPKTPGSPPERTRDPAGDLAVRAALAQVYLKLGRPDDASRLYADIIAVRPHDWTALNNRAFLLKDQDPAAALPLAEQAVKLQPSDPEVLDTLVEVLRALGTRNPAAAADAAARALSGRPNDPRLAATLGLLLRRQGQLDESLRVLARAYATTPTDPGLAYQYAESLAASQDPAAARTVLERISKQPFAEQTAAQALLRRLQH